MPHTKNHGIFRRKADNDRMQIVSLQEMSRRWHDNFKLVAQFSYLSKETVEKMLKISKNHMHNIRLQKRVTVYRCFF
jgi:hypothetical protein